MKMKTGYLILIIIYSLFYFLFPYDVFKNWNFEDPALGTNGDGWDNRYNAVLYLTNDAKNGSNACLVDRTASTWDQHGITYDHRVDTSMRSNMHNGEAYVFSTWIKFLGTTTDFELAAPSFINIDETAYEPNKWFFISNSGYLSWDGEWPDSFYFQFQCQPNTVHYIVDDMRLRYPDFITSERSGLVLKYNRMIKYYNDDALETTDGVVKTKDVNFAMFNAVQKVKYIGMRWTEIALPPKSLVLDSYIQFVASETSSDKTEINIRVEKTTNSQIFYESTNNISSRTTIDRTIKWEVPSWIAEYTGASYRTPNLRRLVEDISYLPGWSASNSISFIMEGTGSRTAYAFDYIGIKSTGSSTSSFSYTAKASPRLIIEVLTNTNLYVNANDLNLIANKISYRITSDMNVTLSMLESWPGTDYYKYNLYNAKTNFEGLYYKKDKGYIYYKFHTFDAPEGYYNLEIKGINDEKSTYKDFVYLIGPMDSIINLKNLPAVIYPKNMQNLQISYQIMDLLEQKHLNINIYDINGRLIKKVVDEKQGAGLHTKYWDLKDSYGHYVPNGIYIFELKYNVQAKILIRRPITLIR